MSTGRQSPPLPSPGPAERRRASVTGQTFQDLMNRQSNPTTPYPGPITTAAVNAQRRRLSLTTVGLGASSNQTPTFQTPRPRTESLSSANSGSVDESPFEDDTVPITPGTSSNPATPFARRLSFGARAMRDVRQSNGNQGNSNAAPSKPVAASPSPSSSSLPHVFEERFKHHPDKVLGEHELTSILSPTGEGYNFAENLRSRAERTSMSGAHPLHSPQAQQHQRAKSLAVMEPPARELPKEPRVPDAMQERILKGDFYMD